MKKELLFIFLFVLSVKLFSQDSFDHQLKDFTNRIATKLSEKGKDTLAIWHFMDYKNQKTKLSNYVADDISVHMVDNNKKFYVLDRFFVDQILNEHQLKSDRFIKPESAKELGKFIHADYIITGNAFRIGNNIKIRVKVLDTESSQKVLADQIQIPIDANMASFLGLQSESPKSSNFLNDDDVLKPIKIPKQKETNNNNISTLTTRTY